jgi:hypothetical protein
MNISGYVSQSRIGIHFRDSLQQRMIVDRGDGMACSTWLT